MKQPIPIYLAVEDELSEWVARRALDVQSRRFAVGSVFGHRGFDYLKRQTPAFNNAAKGCPFLLLTDLDRCSCPPALIAEWLPVPKHRHFLLRVAVREVESWLLGDALGLGKFLRLRTVLQVPDPESLPDPKQAVLAAAMKCPSRMMREALVWRDERSGRLFQGPDYNGALAHFVMNEWDVAAARHNCRSLDGLLAALLRLESEYKDA
jgi:hypothetical protein